MGFFQTEDYENNTHSEPAHPITCGATPIQLEERWWPIIYYQINLQGLRCSTYAGDEIAIITTQHHPLLQKLHKLIKVMMSHA